jgi:hypothetical protein
LIDFDASETTAWKLLHECHRTWFDAAHAVIGPDNAKTATRRPSDSAGFQGIPCLVLAGGCFALTLGGLVLPGIPTVPFLIAGSYFLARSSPRLHQRLLHFPLVGPVLQEWERFRSLGTESKDKLLKLGLGILVLSAALDPLDPVALTFTLLFGALAVSGLRSLPTVSLPRNADHAGIEGSESAKG